MTMRRFLLVILVGAACDKPVVDVDPGTSGDSTSGGESSSDGGSDGSTSTTSSDAESESGSEGVGHGAGEASSSSSTGESLCCPDESFLCHGGDACCLVTGEPSTVAPFDCDNPPWDACTAADECVALNCAADPCACRADCNAATGCAAVPAC